MLADWVFRVFLDYLFFGFGSFSFADTKLVKSERVWKFFRRREGFGRRGKGLPDEGFLGGMGQKKAAAGFRGGKFFVRANYDLFQASEGNSDYIFSRVLPWHSSRFFFGCGFSLFFGLDLGLAIWLFGYG